MVIPTVKDSYWGATRRLIALKIIGKVITERLGLIGIPAPKMKTASHTTCDLTNRLSHKKAPHL
ncbi:MAG: hypothetical protein CL532_05175 [Aestuariivita sp.]|nr:hypothetical protein [Aestuariivita sp.]|tara:strand:- start:276 stop:467 length:192 start_codon:yes stop_codon:yes gene_type:complete